MKGKVRPVSLARRVVIDLMQASVPVVVIERAMRLDRLVEARASSAKRPSWAAIIAKAFCIVARDEPWLRTYYLKWPWPHFYEVPKSVAMIAVTRDSIEKNALVFAKIAMADELSLQDIHDHIMRAKSAPLDEVPSIKKILRIARLPLPLRRLIWTIGLSIGRQRANHFGTFAITSIASLGSETVVARTPGPSLLSYGFIHSDHTMKLLFHWDHRIYDAVLAANALTRLENVLNNDIADELRAS